MERSRSFCWMYDYREDSMTVAGGEHHTGNTKSHRTRTLALDPIGVEVLRRHWTYMVDLSNEAESPLVSDPHVLSYNANGALAGQPGHTDAPVW